MRIDIVQAGGLDQSVQDSSPLATAIGAAEQPGLPSERHAAQSAFGGVVRQADLAVFKGNG